MHPSTQNGTNTKMNTHTPKDILLYPTQARNPQTTYTPKTYSHRQTWPSHLLVCNSSATKGHTVPSPQPHPTFTLARGALWTDNKQETLTHHC